MDLLKKSFFGLIVLTVCVFCGMLGILRIVNKCTYSISFKGLK
jgi:hypothetical protein